MLAPISDETFAELKAKHGEGAVCVVATAAGDVALRRPTRAEYLQFTDKIADAKNRADAMDRIVRQCVVAPPLAELSEALETQPGIVVSCVSPLLEMAGVREEAAVRK
jgi:hypothetical protein